MPAEAARFASCSSATLTACTLNLAKALMWFPKVPFPHNSTARCNITAAQEELLCVKDLTSNDKKDFERQDAS